MKRQKMNRILIRRALKREKGRNIIPCGQETTLKSCIIIEPLIGVAHMSYNIQEDHSTRTVMIRRKL